MKELSTGLVLIPSRLLGGEQSLCNAGMRGGALHRWSTNDAENLVRSASGELSFNFMTQGVADMPRFLQFWFTGDVFSLRLAWGLPR